MGYCYSQFLVMGAGGGGGGVEKLVPGNQSSGVDRDRGIEGFQLGDQYLVPQPLGLSDQSRQRISICASA